MIKLKKLAAATLVIALTVGSPSYAQQTSGVLDRAAVDQAIAEKVLSDESARDTIRTLLGREDVKAMAKGMGLDVRRATNAISSLEGADLERVAQRAALTNDLLGAGTTNINISLVALLLIIIIVILVTK